MPLPLHSGQLISTPSKPDGLPQELEMYSEKERRRSHSGSAALLWFDKVHHDKCLSSVSYRVDPRTGRIEVLELS